MGAPLPLALSAAASAELLVGAPLPLALSAVASAELLVGALLPLALSDAQWEWLAPAAQPTALMIGKH